MKEAKRRTNSEKIQQNVVRIMEKNRTGKGDKVCWWAQNAIFPPCKIESTGLTWVNKIT